jgi:hypothetical protein
LFWPATPGAKLAPAATWGLTLPPLNCDVLTPFENWLVFRPAVFWDALTPAADVPLPAVDGELLE